MFKFRLKPDTHGCQFQTCKTGLLATKVTLVNVVGTILSVYSCNECHARWHGARTDDIKLKSPLPGAD